MTPGALIILFFVSIYLIHKISCFKNYIEQFQNFHSDVNNNPLSNQTIKINDLKYGNYDQMTSDFVKNHSIQSFPLPLPLNEMNQPPENLSQQTIKELDFLLNLSQNANDQQKKSADNYEKNIFDEFITYCHTNKLFYERSYLEQIQNDIKSFCLQLKSLYNRPRPYQLGFYIRKNILPRPIVHSMTPSYPSYSTLLSKTLANVLSYNNPNHSENLHIIAKEVELSRLIGGYNYPSDNQASLQIAAIIKKYIKYLEIPKK